MEDSLTKQEYGVLDLECDDLSQVICVAQDVPGFPRLYNRHYSELTCTDRILVGGLGFFYNDCILVFSDLFFRKSDEPVALALFRVSARDMINIPNCKVDSSFAPQIPDARGESVQVDAVLRAKTIQFATKLNQLFKTRTGSKDGLPVLEKIISVFSNNPLVSRISRIVLLGDFYGQPAYYSIQLLSLTRFAGQHKTDKFLRQWLKYFPGTVTLYPISRILYTNAYDPPTRDVLEYISVTMNKWIKFQTIICSPLFPNFLEEIFDLPNVKRFGTTIPWWRCNVEFSTICRTRQSDNS